MNSRLKLHALRPLPYETSVNWTLCQKYVEREQIAAFEEGVTCKNCLNILQFNRECEIERAARRNR